MEGFFFIGVTFLLPSEYNVGPSNFPCKSRHLGQPTEANAQSQQGRHQSLRVEFELLRPSVKQSPRAFCFVDAGLPSKHVDQQHHHA